MGGAPQQESTTRVERQPNPEPETRTVTRPSPESRPKPHLKPYPQPQAEQHPVPHSPHPPQPAQHHRAPCHRASGFRLHLPWRSSEAVGQKLCRSPRTRKRPGQKTTVLQCNNRR